MRTACWVFTLVLLATSTLLVVNPTVRVLAVYFVACSLPHEPGGC